MLADMLIKVSAEAEVWEGITEVFGQAAIPGQGKAMLVCTAHQKGLAAEHCRGTWS